MQIAYHQEQTLNKGRSQGEQFPKAGLSKWTWGFTTEADV